MQVLYNFVDYTILISENGGNVFIEIKFHGFVPFLVDLNCIWDPTVGTRNGRYVDGADSEALNFGLECV